MTGQPHHHHGSAKARRTQLRAGQAGREVGEVQLISADIRNRESPAGHHQLTPRPRKIQARNASKGPVCHPDDGSGVFRPHQTIGGGPQAVSRHHQPGARPNQRERASAAIGRRSRQIMYRPGRAIERRRGGSIHQAHQQRRGPHQAFDRLQRGKGAPLPGHPIGRTQHHTSQAGAGGVTSGHNQLRPGPCHALQHVGGDAVGIGHRPIGAVERRQYMALVSHGIIPPARPDHIEQVVLHPR